MSSSFHYGHDSAYFLFMDVPEGTEFGMDYKSWTVGPKFRGLKMIPPGVHFVFYSACDQSRQTGPRSGFFYDFKPGEMVVRKWDKYNEEMKSDNIPDEEIQRFKDNLADIDTFLGPYPMDSYKTWASLTSHLTGDNMRRLQPISHQITSVPQLFSEPSDSQSRLKQAKNATSKPPLDVNTKQSDGFEEERSLEGSVGVCGAGSGMDVDSAAGGCVRGGECGAGECGGNVGDDMKVDVGTESLSDNSNVNLKRLSTGGSESGVWSTHREVNTYGNEECTVTAKSSITSEFSDAAICPQVPSKSTNASDINSETTRDCLPSMSIIPGTEIRFSPIPKRKYPPGASPDEISRYCMDSSHVLEHVLNDLRPIGDPQTTLLGEIQFAFVCFLIGQVYDAFDQWKRLVSLICAAESAIGSYPRLFLDFITVLHFEVREVPRDFFVDIVTRDNFLTATLHELFGNVESGGGGAGLRSRALKFRRHLEQKFRWDFTTEPSEYAPVVIETD